EVAGAGARADGGGLARGGGGGRAVLGGGGGQRSKVPRQRLREPGRQTQRRDAGQRGRRAAGQHLVQDDPGGPQVDGGAGLAAPLLGRHVEERAHRLLDGG